MIIEFIGAPGAGKTTLLPGVIRHFESRNCPAYTVVEAARPFASRTMVGKAVQQLAPASWRQPLLWRVFYWLSVAHRVKFMARHSRLVGQVLTSQRQRPAEADVRQRQVLPWLFRHMGYYEFLRSQAQPADVLIFDEGFVHRVVQLFASSAETPAKSDIAAYINRLPRPDLLIYVQASPALCQERIYQRGLWQRAQHKTPDQIARFVANAHLAVTLAVAHARSQQWPVLEVANDGEDVTAVQTKLQQQLAQIPVGQRPVWGVQAAS